MGVPGNANALLLRSAAAAGGYQVSRSLRFNSPDSAYLSRTPASAGNRKTFTWSAWVKRAKLGAGGYIFSCDPNSSNYSVLYWDTGTVIDALSFQEVSGGTQIAFRRSAATYRDPSAWYHIVFVVDTTQATASNRIKMYVNGSQITDFNSQADPSQNADFSINSANQHNIGRMANFAVPFDGYLADIWFLDGIAATPSDFAETDATTGQWIPKTYSGSKGSNGFHLEFADNSNNTASTLGKDTSGNSNNWTPNNLSVTAGAGNDSLVDTPTSYGTDTGAGGEVRGNFCTWNALDNAGTLANGNLDFSQASAAFRNVRSTFAVSSGKWYWEATLSAIGGAAYIGIGKSTADLTVNIGGTDTWGYVNDGKKQSGNTAAVSYGASYTTGDVIGVAFDADNGTLTFYKNGTSQGQAYSGLTSGPYFMMVTGYNGTTWAANFGTRAFSYTAPSGFKALVDTNLTAPVIAKPNEVMDVVLYTGNSSARSITGFNFSPDFVWIKPRSVATQHNLYDAVRGATKALFSDFTDAEATVSNGLTAFNSDGFSLGSNQYVNDNAVTFVGWAWDAGTSTVSNTQGSITSSVRANATAGFSVITYTPGSGGAHTIGHGLGVTPAFYIIKSRGAAADWRVYHKNLPTPATDYLTLNSTAAYATASNYWNGGPTSTLIGLGNYSAINDPSVNFVCYAFSPVAGYSSMGVWTGNGSTDGPFVYTGFRPRWIMYKVYSGDTGHWFIHDTARDPYNEAKYFLNANLSNAETTSVFYPLDILSNGFKIRSSNININGSGLGFLYCAFAENPFQYARAR